MSASLSPVLTRPYVGYMRWVNSKFLGQFILGKRGRSNLSGYLHRQFGCPASPAVYRLGGGLKMSRVDARGLIAQMIYMKTGWDRPNLLFVHKPMSEDPLRIDDHTAISGSTDIASDADPAMRFISAILDYPHVRSNLGPEFEVPDVAPNESDVFADNVADLGIRHRCDWRWKPTTALANPSRVWGSYICTPRPSAPRVMVEKALIVPLSLIASRTFIDPGVFSAPTFAKHGRTITNAQGGE